MGKQGTKKAERTHCVEGHELTEGNIRLLNKGSGRVYKQCLTCKPYATSQASESSAGYEKPKGSRMQWAMSKGVFGDGMTRAEIMRNRS
jgi:hypothetical protein